MTVPSTDSCRGLPRDDPRALTLLRQYGRTATAFQVLAPGLSHWFAPADGTAEITSDRRRSTSPSEHTSGELSAEQLKIAPTAPAQPHAADRGMVGYADTGSAWVAAGEPIAAPDDTVAMAEAFVEHAAAAGKQVAFFATEGALSTSPRFRRVLIGEQPVWNPAEWQATLKDTRSLREQLRRARAKGVTVRAYTMADAGTDSALQGLMKRWLATRAMPAMHFMVELEPFVHRDARRLYVAEQNGTPVALLSLAPVSARNGWMFENLLRDPAAPNGTAELVLDCAMRELAADGVTWATLGLAPLSGDVVGWLRSARTLARPFFNFTGLTAFKRKLRPSSWEPIYLVYPRERSSIWAMRDALRAFAGGSLTAFAMRTVSRGPPPLLRALEFSLIPWTIALSLWPADPWFPSPAVKWSWVIFDVLLLGALFRLRAHWSRGLAAAIASFVTADALLTLWQALAWNVSRTRTALELLMVVVACAGPALAAVVLWGALRRQSILEHYPDPLPAVLQDSELNSETDSAPNSEPDSEPDHGPQSDNS